MEEGITRFLRTQSRAQASSRITANMMRLSIKSNLEIYEGEYEKQYKTSMGINKKKPPLGKMLYVYPKMNNMTVSGVQRLIGNNEHPIEFVPLHPQNVIFTKHALEGLGRGHIRKILSDGKVLVPREMYNVEKNRNGRIIGYKTNRGKILSQECPTLRYEYDFPATNRYMEETGIVVLKYCFPLEQYGKVKRFLPVVATAYIREKKISRANNQTI